MDSITQFFISSYDNVLSLGFICNLMIFISFLEGMASIISTFKHISR